MCLCVYDYNIIVYIPGAKRQRYAVVSATALIVPINYYESCTRIRVCRIIIGLHFVVQLAVARLAGVGGGERRATTTKSVKYYFAFADTLCSVIFNLINQFFFLQNVRNSIFFLNNLNLINEPDK